jgi:hypothetical protein
VKVTGELVREGGLPAGAGAARRLRFEVQRQGDAAGALELRYETATPGALAGDHAVARGDDDYVPTSGALRLAPGEASAHVEVAIVGDRRSEADELVALTVRVIGGADIAVTGLAAIVDDDRGFDFNGDGYADLLVGAPSRNQQRGGAYLFLGGPRLNQESCTRGADLLFEDLDGLGRFGHQIVGGDVNGDGYDDAVIAAPHAEAEGIQPAGIIRVFFGQPVLPATPPVPDLQLIGKQHKADFGKSLAVADINGDELDDIIVGAATARQNGNHAGAVFVFHGRRQWPRGQVSATESDTLIQGLRVGDRFGILVAAAGDTDGDGVEDFVVSSEGYRLELRPTVYLFHGSRGSQSSGPHAPLLASAASAILQGNDLFATAVTGEVDVDGDGRDELLVAAPGENNLQEGECREPPGKDGTVFVYRDRATEGASMRRHDEAELAIRGHDDNFFGTAVAPAGDVNGDGFGDILVGHPFATENEYRESGTVRLYLGSAGLLRRGAEGGAEALDYLLSLSQLLGRADADRLGSTVAGGLDFNGDGFHDFVAATSSGAPQAPEDIEGANASRAEQEPSRISELRGVLGGPDLGGEPNERRQFTIRGADAGDEFGLAIAPAGAARITTFAPTWVERGLGTPTCH